MWSLFFEQDHDGTWTASADTDDGEIAGTGATILEARRAFDERMKQIESEDAE